MADTTDIEGIKQLYSQIKAETESLKRTQLLDQTFKFLLKRQDKIPKLIGAFIENLDYGDLMLCHWLLDRLPALLPHMKGKPEVNELMAKVLDIILLQFKHKKFPPAFLVQTSCFVIRFLMDQIRDNPSVSASLAQPLKTLIDILLNVPLTDMQVKVMMIKCFQTMIVSLSGVGSDLKFKAANSGFDNIPFHEKSQQVLKYLEKGLSNDRSFNVLTAIINAFTIICLERPPYSDKIIDLMINFYNSPPSYLNGFQLKCIQKSIKVQIINLNKHNRNNQFSSKLTKAAEEFLRSNPTTQSPPTDAFVTQASQPTTQTQQPKYQHSRPPFPEQNQHNAPRPQRPQQNSQQSHPRPNFNQGAGPPPPFQHQPRPMGHRGGQFIPRPPLPQHLRPPLPPPPPFQRPPPPPLPHDFPPNPQFMHMHQPNPLPYLPHPEYPPEQFNEYPPYEEYDQPYYHPEHPPQDPMMEYDEEYSPYADTNYPPFADNAMNEPHHLNSGYPDQHMDYYPDDPHQDWPLHGENETRASNHPKQQFGYDPHPRSGPSTPPFAQSHNSPPTMVHESRRQNFTAVSNEEHEEFERPLPRQQEPLEPQVFQQPEQPSKPTPESSIQTPSEATPTPQPSVAESDRRESQSPTMVPGEDFTENNTLIDSIPSSPSVESVEEEFQLTDTWINSIKALSFKRLLQKGTQITAKDKSEELVGLDWMVLSSRIASLKPLPDLEASGQSGDLRRIMFEFISADFKTNLPLMLNWMLEEFYKWGSDLSSEKPSPYSHWLHKLLNEINPPPPDVKYASETKESKLVAPILLNIPTLTNHCFEWLWKWCESPQCTLTGFHCLRELLYNRPATRSIGLEKLLAYSVSTDHLFRNAAIDTSQRLAITCPSITESIVSFAIKSFSEVGQVKVPNCLKTLEDMANEMKQKQLEKELEAQKEGQAQDAEGEGEGEDNGDNESLAKSPKSMDQKKRNFEILSDAEEDTANEVEEEDPSQAKAKYDLEIIRRSELYCGIVAKKPELVKEFLNSFNKACSQVQDSLQRKLKILINELGGDNPYLLESIEEYISSAPNMVFNILNTLVEKGNVADELITTLKQIYQKGELMELNWEFLDTVLPKLNKKQIYQFIPIIVGHISLDEEDPEKNRDKIKGLLLTLLDPHKDADGNAKFKNPLTAVDLLVQLHLLTTVDEVEKFNEAIQICINIPSTFTVDSIAETLKTLVDQPQLPVLLVQTMIKSVKVYTQLTSPVNGLLLKLIQNHSIWTHETLWIDFIECCKLTTPQSFNVLLQLPKVQLEEVIVNHNELLLGLSKHIKNKMNHNQQMRVYALLPMLDVRLAAPQKHGNKSDNRDGKGGNKDGGSSKDRRSGSQTNKRQRSDTNEGKSDTARDPSADSKKRNRGH